MNEEYYFIGVDVGSSSIRAALVSHKGTIAESSSLPIHIYNPKPSFYEQSSDNIWETCISVIKKVSGDSDSSHNVIMWMDHRAEAEAAFINEKFKGDDILKSVGGQISLEMQIPKLMWLKRNLGAEFWKRVGLFIDLGDFLTWKATGVNARSQCSLVCKWLYEVTPSSHQWNRNFMTALNLDDLLLTDKIGASVLEPGTKIGSGLLDDVAQILGFDSNVTVASALIDAHAGALALLGTYSDRYPFQVDNKLGLICGTSTCHMVLTREPVFVNGVWGPYFNVILPNFWLNEGGQSSTGKLIDHILSSHPAYTKICAKITDEKQIYQYLCQLLETVACKLMIKNIAFLTKDVHIWPDFHGNRSPLNNPKMRGMITGLTLATDEIDLAVLYLATLQALTFGTKLILETMQNSGLNGIKSIVICGGLSSSQLFKKIHADVLQLPILCPFEAQSMLLGSAMLAANASGIYGSMQQVMQKMASRANVINPDLDQDLLQFYQKKYLVFLEMLQSQQKFIALMN